MKQVLGKKKHRLCEDIADREYTRCYTSGHYDHYWAECWFGPKDSQGRVNNADWVNYRTREVQPKYRNGETVK